MQCDKCRSRVESTSSSAPMLLLRCAVPSRRDFQKRPLAMLLTHVAFPKHWRKLNLVLNNQQKQTSRRQTTPRCENVTSYFQQDETRPDELAEGSDIRDEGGRKLSKRDVCRGNPCGCGVGRFCPRFTREPRRRRGDVYDPAKTLWALSDSCLTGH
jgi:DNA-directed RNA polymerase subunit M/transcription elongation factor TFIIS